MSLKTYNGFASQILVSVGTNSENYDISFHSISLMITLGFEPRTSALSERRSNQAELRDPGFLKKTDFIKLSKAWKVI
jgi:hypothetical protein